MATQEDTQKKKTLDDKIAELVAKRVELEMGGGQDRIDRQHASGKWSTMSQRNQVSASVTVQRLAITHLGTRHNFRRSHVAAARQRWWAWTSRNKLARWAHILAAVTLEPDLVRRKLEGPRRSTDEGA